VTAPRLVRLNTALAGQLCVDPAKLALGSGIEVLAGNRIAAGSEPFAMAYAGHQFGGFVPQLGDGRALLLGEVIDRDGNRRDIALKGSGPTPFSRRGDGRAALGPVLREFLISEAMAALGIPTTRSLAAVATGDPVYRETVLPGAVLTRVASSHIRVGTFQYFAARGDYDGVKLLADHVIARHYPEVAQSEHPYLALLDAVVTVQARLISQWMLVGFIHGVMNTDNCSIAGETIDYGPCAFMDAYHPGTVYSSIDHAGRYAFGNQPGIAQWNLARLAETLLPLLSDNKERSIELATAALAGFAAEFERTHNAGLCRKIGLREGITENSALAKDLLDRMAENEADFTLTFRHLANAAADASADAAVRQLFKEPAAFDSWAAQWRVRLADEGDNALERREAMRHVNPKYIPRNHRVEEALNAAVANDDMGPFELLLAVLAAPFDEQPENEPYTNPPRPHEVVDRTFCGT
jgi:uncharacterized protein YdiU (UPF0061 family)